MRLLFLGTAAAEAYPAVFCGCDNCEQARRLGGHSLRHRSSLLVDHDLLIDLGPDVIHAALAYGLRLHHLRTVLITHAHEDHFDPNVLRWRAPGFRVQPLPHLTIYAPPQVTRVIEALDNRDELDLEARPVAPYDHFPAHDTQVWAFPARHGTEAPLFYAVERGAHKLLYACDTGALSEEVWRALAAHQFDAIIMEETMGTSSAQLHINLDEITAHRSRALKEGILKPQGRFIATHFSHRCNPTHERLGALLRPSGVEVAHDGMEVMLE